MDFLLLLNFLISNEHLAHKSDTLFTFNHFNQRSNPICCQMHKVYDVLVNNHVFTCKFILCDHVKQ